MASEVKIDNPDVLKPESWENLHDDGDEEKEGVPGGAAAEHQEDADEWSKFAAAANADEERKKKQREEEERVRRGEGEMAAASGHGHMLHSGRAHMPQSPASDAGT